MASFVSRKQIFFLIATCHFVALLILLLWMQSGSQEAVFQIILLAPLFPLGLPLKLGIPPFLGEENGLLILGYLFYLSHLLATLFISSKKGMAISLIVLVVALFLNISGCKETLEGLAGIGN